MQLRRLALGEKVQPQVWSTRPFGSRRDLPEVERITAAPHLGGNFNQLLFHLTSFLFPNLDP